ncbi:MAG: hypothetical protein Q8K86_10550 [Candidatus Nanopelagicaceae bacterium]|nr:hypothetical protein [Candidatus Nanopelagicaceae bacterium]
MQFQQAIGQFLFFSVLIFALVTAVIFWLLYYVIKCGVRDGIKEGVPRAAWRNTVAQRRPNDGLPDMRAD